MEKLPHQTATSYSKPPAVVMLCSVGVALIGVLSPICIIVLMRDIVGSTLLAHPDTALWAVCATVGIGISLVAAIQYWRCRMSGVYLHMLALVVQLPVIVVVVGLMLAAVVLVVSLAILAAMVISLKARSAITIIVIGLGLTCASFFYQRMGPEIGQYGTECIPIDNCFRPLLGGGFPLQYIVDQPGHTPQSVLDQWDDIRMVPIFLDTLFYFAVVYAGFRLIHYCRARRKQYHKAG